jgi:hypothetical protein
MKNIYYKNDAEFLNLQNEIIKDITDDEGDLEGGLCECLYAWFGVTWDGVTWDGDNKEELYALLIEVMKEVSGLIVVIDDENEVVQFEGFVEE